MDGPTRYVTLHIVVIPRKFLQVGGSASGLQEIVNMFLSGVECSTIKRAVNGLTD